MNAHTNSSVEVDFMRTVEVLQGNQSAVRPLRDKLDQLNSIQPPSDRTPICPPTQFESEDFVRNTSFQTVGHQTHKNITKVSRLGTPSFRSYSVKLSKPCPPISPYHIDVYKKVRLLSNLCSP